MGFEKKFNNAVPEKKEKKKELKELTVLKESDEKTIYNLIFSEKSDQKDSQKP